MDGVEEIRRQLEALTLERPVAGDDRGALTRAIREAEGNAQAVERLADAEKYRVHAVTEALGEDAAPFLIGMRYMETLDRMDRARALYEKFGFQRVLKVKLK